LSVCVFLYPSVPISVYMYTLAFSDELLSILAGYFPCNPTGSRAILFVSWNLSIAELIPCLSLATWPLVPSGLPWSHLVCPDLIPLHCHLGLSFRNRSASVFCDPI
jgi:hypothetical protein